MHIACRSQRWALSVLLYQVLPYFLDHGLSLRLEPGCWPESSSDPQTPSTLYSAGITGIHRTLAFYVKAGIQTHILMIASKALLTTELSLSPLNKLLQTVSHACLKSVHHFGSTFFVLQDIRYFLCSNTGTYHFFKKKPGSFQVVTVFISQAGIHHL